MTESSTWTGRLLEGAEETTWRMEARRFVEGVGLAALFGGAIGLRSPHAGALTHALGVAVGFLGVGLLAVPALAIVLALADASTSALALGRATSRAVATAGLVLAGLAPGAALFAVSVEDAVTVTVVASGGLVLAGALAMRSFAHEIGPQLDAARARHATRIALPCFLAFAGVLGARIWWVMLPTLRGGL
ncbi:MAG: hypothetical protein KF819_14750 [Labilithrix sp.]|nr:hypothetical protein [Labilithrix sp.]